MIKCVCGSDDDGDDVDEGHSAIQTLYDDDVTEHSALKWTATPTYRADEKQETQTHTQKKHTRRINITCETAIVC